MVKRFIKTPLISLRFVPNNDKSRAKSNNTKLLEIIIKNTSYTVFLYPIWGEKMENLRYSHVFKGIITVMIGKSNMLS